jgi:hypothetical protein
MKLQQAYLEIDENSMDGRPLLDSDFTLLADLPQHKLARNQRLLALAARALSRSNGNIGEFELD